MTNSVGIAFILALIALFATSCSGRTEKKQTISEGSTTLEEVPVIIVMEKFDIQKFNANQTEGEWEYTDENGYERSQIASADGYIERRKKPGDLFEEYRSFDIDGDLRAQGLTMINGGFVKGTMYKFDKSGKIVEQKNFDKPFLFDWERVYQFTQERSIDLYHNHTRIRRDWKNPQNPTWKIVWEHDELPGCNVVILSGLDGRIIEDRFDYYEE